MKNLNDKENMHRKAYWLIVSPYEKQIIAKIRNKEIQFPPKVPEEGDSGSSSLSQQKDKSENKSSECRKRSLKRQAKLRDSQMNASVSAASEPAHLARNTPFKPTNAGKDNKISPYTEIIGGNIYWSDSESAQQKSMMTPRRIQLLDSSSQLKAVDCLWESSPKVLESSEMTPENKITLQRKPLARIRQSWEEDKNEVPLSEASSSGEEPSSGSSNFRSSPKFGKKSSHSAITGRKRREIIAEISSEILQKEDLPPEPNKGERKPGWCPKWGPCVCQNPGSKTSVWGKRSLKPNQEEIYKLALKRASGEMQKCKETISAQQEQICQYKIRINDLNGTIDNLTRVINELTEGDLQRILDQNED